MTDLRSAAAGAACPACGAGLPPAARFCPACGEPLTAVREERRVVTVLFADLVGSTGLIEQLDPEAARGLLDGVFQRLATEIRRFGGVVEKFIGDAILAVFGFPTAHGDDAARAVRAALAMREAVSQEHDELRDSRLRLRIGLHTGEVVAGTVAGNLRVTGDTVHTAARIQQAAAPDEVLISTRTQRAVQEVVHAGPPRWLHPRGKQRPIEVVEVSGLSPAEPAAAALVDREDDLARLRAALDEATARGGLVLLVGDAGIGKSALVRAAVEQLGEGVRVLWGRCLPDWQGLPLWPLREMLADAAGVPATSPEAALAAAVRRLLDEALGTAPAESRPTAAAVLRLLGLEAVEQAPPDHRPAARELAAALVTVLERLAARHPVLAVVEDLHWATPDLLDVIAVLADRGGRLGVLGVTRSELPAEQPQWVRATGAHRIDLRGLPPDWTSTLLTSVLGAPVPTGLSGHVFDTSQGNPLFVRELALAIRDTGRPADGSLPIPDSLQDLIAARLDRLPSPSKQLLCQAGVIGRSFSPAATAALAARADRDVHQELVALAEAGLIEQLPGELPAPRYTFQHALFREVAYSLLPKASRSALHRRLAEWLGSEPEDELTLPEVIAYHLVQAVRLASDIRNPTAEDRLLAARAMSACRRAAKRLQRQEAAVAAVRMLDDALAMAALAQAPEEEVAELRADRGTLRGAVGDPGGALADLRVATTAKRAAVRATAYTELSNLLGRLNDFAGADAAAERALAEARATGNPGLLARALHARAQEPFLAGNLVASERLLEDALAAASRSGRADLVVDLRSSLLTVRLHLDTVPLASLAAEAESLAGAARAAGRRNAEAGAHLALGEALRLQGDLDGAERALRLADSIRQDIGLTMQRLWSLIRLARVAMARGDAAGARRLAGEAIRLSTGPEGDADPEAELQLAEACLLDGDLGTAAAALDRGERNLHEGDVLTKARLLRARASLASGRGDVAGAVELLGRSLDCLEGRDYGMERLRIMSDLAGQLRLSGREEAGAELAGRVAGRAAAIGASALLTALETAP